MDEKYTFVNIRALHQLYFHFCIFFNSLVATFRLLYPRNLFFSSAFNVTKCDSLLNIGVSECKEENTDQPIALLSNSTEQNLIKDLVEDIKKSLSNGKIIFIVVVIVYTIAFIITFVKVVLCRFQRGKDKGEFKPLYDSFIV